jgi:peptidoglycan/LPS O-acetylase OafA/YrhL
VAATTLGRDVRPEIQALRAVAVLLVLVYHLWPDTLRGGFIGVDVFFAISGYLITAHLLREVHATGRVSLPAFWARRARRILPASLVVLLVCTIATIAFVPRLHWETFLEEIRASAL